MSPIVKPIPSAPRYLATSEGRIIGPSGRLLAGCPNEAGYQQVLVYRLGAGRASRRVHVLVCEAFHGPRPSPRHHAAHRDGDLSNNRPENLRWATPRENTADKVRHGTVTRTRGEVDGMAKLTSEQVREIRRRYAAGERQPAIAAAYGVKQPTISNIITGKTWGHLA